uniref:C2 domain-containing protein n=1 Tax=Anabas testudineus TaxID=64144 RepID=A0A7N6BRA7_ANATE
MMLDFLTVYNMRASGLPSSGLTKPDGFVKVYCNSVFMGQTAVVKNNANPVWGNEFSYSKASVNDLLRLEIYDEDIGSHDLLGICKGNLKRGTYSSSCSLSKGGTLRFTYRLG